MSNETRLFHCSNGKVYACDEKCCLFCDHCSDLFYDYTNGPYMLICDIAEDTELGMTGLCKFFKEGDTE